VNELTPEPREAPDGADLGLTPDEWMDLQFAYNSGLMEPGEGTVEDEAFRRMDAEVVRDYLRRCERDRADARYRAWAQTHPEEAASSRPKLRPSGLSLQRGGTSTTQAPPRPAPGQAWTRKQPIDQPGEPGRITGYPCAGSGLARKRPASHVHHR